MVLVTACDNGKPNRCSTALVFVPLQNANCNPPQYTAPVIILAAITLQKSTQLGILNAWDIDGDKVTYSMDPTSLFFNFIKPPHFLFIHGFKIFKCQLKKTTKIL